MQRVTLTDFWTHRVLVPAQSNPPEHSSLYQAMPAFDAMGCPTPARPGLVGPYPLSTNVEVPSLSILLALEAASKTAVTAVTVL